MVGLGGWWAARAVRWAVGRRCTAVVGEAVLVAVLLAGVVAAVVEEAGKVVGHTVVQGEQVEAHGGLTQWAHPQTWRP